MLQLKDNVYNKASAPDESKLKLWTSMGLLLTYQCPAKCEFCYYNCGPKKKGLMSIETAINAWQGLIRIAGEQGKVHITGGEPFLIWRHLKQFLAAAAKSSLGPADIIETNGYWAENKAEITERLEFLNPYIRKFKISYDPFHSEFIDYEKVRMLYETACEVFGADRVMFRWQYYLKNPPKMNGLSDEQRLNVFLESYKQYHFRFTGRAAGKLAQAFANKELGEISLDNCKKSFLDSKSIHIDPHGNVFNGVCSGIVIGNINKTPLDKIWRNFNPAEAEFVNVLFNKGPVGLVEQATKSGYKKSRLYSSKCHLCTGLRQFFFDNGHFRQIISPKDCYN